MNTGDDDKLDTPPAVPVVRDRPEASRFEAVVDGQAAFLEYERRPHSFVLAHTDAAAPERR
jgi:hypothetical protein